MKILKFFFAFALFASFASCSPEELPAETEIFGTWQITSVSLQGTASTTIQDSTTVADITGTGYDMDLKITILEDPKDYSVEGDFSVMVEYEVDGQSYELPWEEVGFIDAGSWEILNDQLTVTSPAQVETATISEITETSLILDWTYTQTETQFGTSIVQDITGTYTFEKL